MIEYKIKPVSPEAHLFQVELNIQNPDPDQQLLSMPAWIPGSYMIRDFARNIVAVDVIGGHDGIKLEKLDKQTWVLKGCGSSITLNYRVYAWDLSVRGAHLDITHGYFNGTSVFLKVHGFEEEACLVEILPPDGKQYADWRVATTLPAHSAKPLAYGIYQASNYEELIDHPVEMGRFTHSAFDVNGVSHEVVITGNHRADVDRICSDLKVICQQHQTMFGEMPEMQRYLFQVMAVGDGYGGLEHRSSTSLICKRDDLPHRGMVGTTEGYRQFLGLCSHEYFHLWNVKRIRPQRLMQSDLSNEAYTTLLWAFEGITSYYDDLALLRAGCITPEEYLEMMAHTISRVMRGSGRLKQSVAESSFDAWTKFYKQDENAPNSIVSYYAKGALIALSLDLLIRHKSEGERSLDDVMRAMWQQYGRQDIGMQESDVESVAESVSGLKLGGFFDQAIRGREDLDLSRYLSAVGIGFQLRAAVDSKDQGGVRKPDESSSLPNLTLGINVRIIGEELTISHVFDGGAAQSAGISAGDVLVAVDGLRVSESSLQRLVNRARDIASIDVVVFRRDELMTFDVTPLPFEANTCDLWFEEAEERVVKQREAWIGQVSANL